MKPGIVQKIYKDYLETYRKIHMLGRRQYHAAGSIMTCRTSDQGYHINVCPLCGSKLKMVLLKEYLTSLNNSNASSNGIANIAQP